MVVACLAVVQIRPPVTLPIALAIAAFAVLTLRPHWLVLTLLVVIGFRSTQIVESLDATTTRPVSSVLVVAVTDAKPRDLGWSVEVELDGDRLFAIGRPDTGWVVDAVAAGDELVVSGTIRGRTPSTSWALSRRIVGTLDIADVERLDHAGGLQGAATAVRNHLRSGAQSLDDDDRALFTGLVFGDDRRQSVVDADNFRAAGLGHLLAVSGQNVLFVLVLVAPILSRIRSLDRRVVATVLVLAFFGFMTRFEPSVTRALVMAGIAAAATSRGRPDAAVLTLPVAVGALLIIDPLLGLSLAFQLSVAATLGLIVISPRLLAVSRSSSEERPGPMAMMLAATGGAQLAVAPLLIFSFGTVSPVALPANLLAGPAAAVVMMWGLTGGAVAGFAPGWLATALHAPTRVAIGWIDLVAATAASVPTGEFTVMHLVLITVLLVLLILLRRQNRSRIRSLVALGALLTLVSPLLNPTVLDSGTHTITDGVMVTRSPGGIDVVVIDGTPRTIDVISSIRRSNVRRIDLLVVTSGSRSTGRLVRQVIDRFDTTDVWAPVGHQIPAARIPPGSGVNIGDLWVGQSAEGSILVREIERSGATVGNDDSTGSFDLASTGGIR